MRTHATRLLTKLLCLALVLGSAGLAAAQASANAPAAATPDPTPAASPTPADPSEAAPPSDATTEPSNAAPTNDSAEPGSIADANATETAGASPVLLYGTVTAGGEPLAGVQLEASGDPGEGSAYTDANGSYALTLSPGVYEVQIHAPDGFADRTVPEYELSADSRLDFELASSGTLAGVVSDAHGAPVADAQVALFNDQGEGASTSTDSEGHYSVDVPEGDYRLSVESDGHAPFAASDVHVGAGEAVAYDVTLGSGGHAAQGFAYENGTPASDVLVIVAHRDASGQIDDVSTDVTDDVGHWSIGPLADGNYTLVGVDNGATIALAFDVSGADTTAPDLQFGGL